MRVAVVDSGGANIASVVHALDRLGARATLTADPERIRAADCVILPGVGAAAPAMRILRERGLDRVVASLQQPLLGICLGMQLLYERSGEGDVACLGLLPGTVRALDPVPGIRIPHIGWNRLRKRGASPLLEGLADGSHVYFVHGYAAPVDVHCVASSEHGREFAAIVQRGNIFGAQFHPERSAAAGARLLSNFLELTVTA